MDRRPASDGRQGVRKSGNGAEQQTDSVAGCNTDYSAQQDAKTLEKIKAKAADVVPTLQREYDEIMRQLEKEQAEVADIEQCDQDYLNELKSSIAEQEWVVLPLCMLNDADPNILIAWK